jgi:DNA-directed RNA polymerase subunit M/transcription elongation factor TFIIS
MAHELINYNGMRFCPTCESLLNPTDKEPSEPVNDELRMIMVFECRKCNDIAVYLNKDNPANFIIKETVYQGQDSKDTVDTDMVLDPSMMRVKIDCPKCHYHTAVAYRSVDNKKGQINLNYICAKVSK